MEKKYPQYQDGIEILSSCPSDYICHICPTHSDPSFNKHLQKQMHRCRLEYFLKYFDDKGSRIQCKICKELHHPKKITEHAQSHKLIPWYRPHNESEILFNNFISCIKTLKHYCHICSITCSTWFLAISHTESTGHKASLNAIIDESVIKNVSLPESYYKFGIEHAIFRERSHTLFCYLCKCNIQNVRKDLVNHGKDSSHKEKEKQLKKDFEGAKKYCLSPIKEKSNNPQDVSSDELAVMQSVCKVCNAEVNPDDMMMHLDFHKENPYEKNSCGVNKFLQTPPVEVIDLVVNAETCDAPIINETNNSASVMEDTNQLKNLKLNKEKTSCASSIKRKDQNSNIDFTLPDGFVRNGTKNVICKVCDVSIEYKEVHLHSESKRHKILQKASSGGMSQLTKGKAKCNLCNCEGIGLNEIEAHLESFQHLSNDPNTCNQTTSSVDEPIVNCRSNVQAAPTYASVVSESSSPSVSQSNQSSFNNISSSSNATYQPSTESAAMEIFNFKEIKFIQCNVCNWVLLDSSSAILRHTNSREHIEKLTLLWPNTYSRQITTEMIFTLCNGGRYFAIQSEADLDMNLMKVIMTPLNDMNSVMERFNWCNVCDAKGWESTSDHQQSPLHLQILHGIKPMDDSRYLFCTHCTCRIFFSSHDFMDHINDYNHLNNKSRNNQQGVKINFQTIQPCFPRQNLPDGIEIAPSEPYFLCTVCNWRLRNFDEVEKHTNNQFHRENIAKNCIIEIRNSMFACLICFDVFRSLRSIEEHLCSRFHHSNCRGMAAFDIRNVVDKLLDPIRAYELSNYSFCLLCNIPLEGDLMITLEHTFDKWHQSLLMEQSSNAKILPLMSLPSNCHLPYGIEATEFKNYFFCTVCNCNLRSLNQMNTHANGTAHKNELRRTYA